MRISIKVPKGFEERFNKLSEKKKEKLKSNLTRFMEIEIDRLESLVLK